MCAYPHFYLLFIHTPHVCPGRGAGRKEKGEKNFDTVPNRRIRTLSKTQKARFTERSEIIFWSCVLFFRLRKLDLLKMPSVELIWCRKACRDTMSRFLLTGINPDFRIDTYYRMGEAPPISPI